MTAAGVLARARAAGLTLAAHGDRLRWRGPRPPAELLHDLAEHKVDVLVLLREEETDAWGLTAAQRAQAYARINPAAPALPSASVVNESLDAADHPLVRAIMEAFPGARILAVHDAAADTCSLPGAGLANAMQRPPSWADPAALPLHGCWCRCCRGTRWWREREAPRGWRCATCYPPDHLPADGRVEVAFVRLSDILR